MRLVESIETHCICFLPLEQYRLMLYHAAHTYTYVAIAPVLWLSQHASQLQPILHLICDSPRKPEARYRYSILLYTITCATASIQLQEGRLGLQSCSSWTFTRNERAIVALLAVQVQVQPQPVEIQAEAIELVWLGYSKRSYRRSYVMVPVILHTYVCSIQDL